MLVTEMTLDKTRAKLWHLLEEKPLVVKKVDLVDLSTLCDKIMKQRVLLIKNLIHLLHIVQVAYRFF